VVERKRLGRDQEVDHLRPDAKLAGVLDLAGGPAEGGVDDRFACRCDPRLLSTRTANGRSGYVLIPRKAETSETFRPSTTVHLSREAILSRESAMDIG